MSNRDSQAILSPDYFKQGSLVLILGVVVGFVADYLFNLTLSQALSSHEYGDYKVAYAFAAITSVLILLGGDRVAPRVLSGPLANGDNRGVWEFLRFYLWIGAALSLVVGRKDRHVGIIGRRGVLPDEGVGQAGVAQPVGGKHRAIQVGIVGGGDHGAWINGHLNPRN